MASPLGADPPMATAARLPRAPGLGTLLNLTLSAWSLWPGNPISGPGSGELILGDSQCPLEGPQLEEEAGARPCPPTRAE